MTNRLLSSLRVNLALVVATIMLLSTSHGALAQTSVRWVSHFVLIDATTNSPIPAFNPLRNGAIVPAETLPKLVTVRSVLFIRPGSVRLALDGVTTITDSINPYGLFGDQNGVFNGRKIPPGPHQVHVTVFSGANGTGQILEQRTLQFTILAAVPTPTPVATSTPLGSPPPITPVPGINADAELLIRQLSVVEDPARTQNKCDPSIVPAGQLGTWSFGRIMRDLAGANDPSDFIVAWLNTFTINQTINGDEVRLRPTMADFIANSWPRLANGKLDLSRPPFRLLAVVYRPDLRNRDRSQAGEGRFIFGALGPNCEPLDFMVIFEFKLLATTCSDTVQWATVFHNLGASFGQPSYNANLQAVTDLFSLANKIPSNPNGSGLNQLRTAERAFSTDGIWDIREFRLGNSAGFPSAILQPVTVKQTPRDLLNGSTVIASFINQNEAAILKQTHAVPADILGGKSRIHGPWNAPGIVNPEARHLFALNTCNGCHSAETGNSGIHVRPRLPGVRSTLSDFLTGTKMPKPDPINAAKLRQFNELARRTVDMSVLLNTNCSIAPAGIATTQQPRSLQVRLGSSEYCNGMQQNNPTGRYRSSRHLRSPFAKAKGRIATLSLPVSKRLPVPLTSCIGPASKTH
jgi:hypothetical protein